MFMKLLKQPEIKNEKKAQLPKPMRHYLRGLILETAPAIALSIAVAGAAYASCRSGSIVENSARSIGSHAGGQDCLPAGSARKY